MADVNVSFGATLEDLVEGVKNAGESIDSLRERVASTAESVTRLAQGLATAFLGREIFEFIEGMGELGERTETLSNNFGITTQQVGLLGFEAKMTGTNAEDLVRSLERMSVSLQQAGDKSTPTAAAVKALGLNAKELSEMPLPDMLDKLREKFSSLEPGMQRTAIAQALVRNGAESILSVLTLSDEKFAEIKQRFDETGAALTGPMAEGFAQTQERIVTFQTALEGLGERIFAVVKPAIDAALDAMTRFIESMNASTIRAAVQTIATDAVNLMESVTTAALQAEKTIDSILIRLQRVGQVGQGLNTLANDMNPLHWGPAIGQIFSGGDTNTQAELAQMNAGIDAQLSASKKMFDGWRQSITTNLSAVRVGLDAVGGAATASAGKGKDKPASLDFGNPSDASSAAKAAVDGQISVLQTGLDRKKVLLQEELNAGRLTQQQYTAAVIAATDEEYQAQVGLLQHELSIGGLKLAQRQEILNKLKDLESKHALEIEQIQAKAADETRKKWTDVANTIASAFSSQVSALLKGTESIGQAVENVALDLATQAIEAAIKSIAASAAQAFAGTVANLAPTLGPAAIGPATAVQGAVIAAGSALSSLDVGTWGLPSDSPIMAHQGEMVIPPFESSLFRDALDNLGGSGGSGGDTHNHFHGAILDGKALLGHFVRALRDNPQTHSAILARP